jgi:signal transduction histidine kinase
MNRRFAVGLGGLALAVSTASVATAVTEVPGAGVWPDGVGGIVRAVDPGGPSWMDGIRPGQRVDALNSDVDPTRWSLETFDGAVFRRSATVGHLDSLRSLIPIAGFAWLLASVGLLGMLGRRQAGLVAASIAFVLASLPLAYSDTRAIALAGGAMSLAGPALIVGSSAIARRSWGFVLIGCALALAIAWLAASVSIVDAFEPLDLARRLAALGLVAAGCTTVLNVDRVRRWIAVREAPHIVDVAALALWLAAIVVAWLILRLDPIPLAAVALALLAIYPAWRRAAIRQLDGWVMADVRARASIAAAEEERARLAREIHDAPLAELSGVIRQLDRVPGARAESDALRTVADHLRDVAVRLHPPVLEDLGLAPAIHGLAEADSSEGASMAVSVDDLTEHGRQARPPEEVELAAYRIVQEAISNARQHASASHIRVIGSVSMDAIELEILDDGTGIAGSSIKKARRDGHFGLDSMVQRAQAIGALLAVEGASPGTSVRFRWTR